MYSFMTRGLDLFRHRPDDKRKVDRLHVRSKKGTKMTPDTHKTSSGVVFCSSPTYVCVLPAHTSFCICMTKTGDLGCQTLEWWGSEEDFVWDHMRSFRMGFTGAFVVTPMSFCWNITAEHLAPGTSWSAVLKKQVVMILATPPMVRGK